MTPDAVVIGAGPNGLVAANLLADRGWSVTVLESEGEPGGGVRSWQLTGQPGFIHDPFSAFYAFGIGSPALRSLDLEAHGLRWRHGRLAVAHPASDGTCVVQSRDLDETAASLDSFAEGDGDAWRRLYARWERVGPHLLDAMTTPMPPVRPALRLAASLRRDLTRFARFMLLPARRLIEEEFRGIGAERLLIGHVPHGDLGPDVPPSGAFAWVLACLAQQHGFPTPEGGAGELARALTARLRSRGGDVAVGSRVARVIVEDGRAVGVETAAGVKVDASRAVLADVSAPALYRHLVGREHLPARLLADLERFEWDSATFKVDWALDAPIPWESLQARLAGVVHIADDLDESTLAAAQIKLRHIPERPVLVLGQYSMVDDTRAPAEADTAWAYTHVPRSPHRAGWDADTLVERIEGRVEELAPGFRGLIRARHVLTPADFELADSNLVLGAMHAGAMQLHQLGPFRPMAGWARPETPVRGLYLASASAHPGGGVHGAPGAIAARAALRRARVPTRARVRAAATR
jgi:phytoene dehydrogenase-like protein